MQKRAFIANVTRNFTTNQILRKIKLRLFNNITRKQTRTTNLLQQSKLLSSKQNNN